MSVLREKPLSSDCRARYLGYSRAPVRDYQRVFAIGRRHYGPVAYLLGYVQRQSFQPLKEAVEVLNRMAQGERNVEMPHQGGFLSSDTDEVGQLINALESYQKELKSWSGSSALRKNLKLPATKPAKQMLPRVNFLQI